MAASLRWTIVVALGASLSAGVIRGLPETLPSGEEGFSLFIEYRFPDSPEERDRIFTVPLGVTPQTRDW